MITYKPSFIPNKFVIIGGGGTGSRLVPLLTQFLKTVNWIQDPSIYIIDPDVVEEKNLARQNFIKMDLNKPKAVVLAERYGKAFDTNITPLVRKLEFGGHVLPANKSAYAIGNTPIYNMTNTIFILCVDTVKARKEILSLLFVNSSGTLQNSNLIIDAGNENDFGQVIFYNNATAYTTFHKSDLPLCYLPDTKLTPGNQDISFLPFPNTFYSDEMTTESEKSCADLDQTLAINSIMATTIMGIIQNFIYVKPMTYNRVNISLLHGNSVNFMTLDNILQHIPNKTEFNGKACSLRYVPLQMSIDSVIAKAMQEVENILYPDKKLNKEVKKPAKKPVDEVMPEPI